MTTTHLIHESITIAARPLIASALGLDIDSIDAANVECPQDASARVRLLCDLYKNRSYEKLDTTLRLMLPVAGIQLAGCDPAADISLVDAKRYASEREACLAWSRAAARFGAFAPRHFGDLVEQGLLDEGESIDVLVDVAHKRASEEHGDFPFNGPSDIEVGGCAEYQCLMFGTSRSVAVLYIDLDERGEVAGYYVGIGYRDGSDPQRGEHWSILDSCLARREARDQVEPVEPRGWLADDQVEPVEPVTTEG